MFFARVSRVSNEALVMPRPFVERSDAALESTQVATRALAQGYRIWRKIERSFWSSGRLFMRLEAIQKLPQLLSEDMYQHARSRRTVCSFANAPVSSQQAT